MVTKNLKVFIEENPDGHVRKHESTVVEYKANFSLGSIVKYAKTIAAFANNRGGAIVFGVTNNPRIPKGMTNENWTKLDPAQLSGELNTIFSPVIEFELDEIVIEDGRRFALIIVQEAK